MCVTVIGNMHRASIFHIYQPLIPSTHIRKRSSSGIFLLKQTSLCFLIHGMMILLINSASINILLNTALATKTIRNNF